jgi:hypothetical protein
VRRFLIAVLALSGCAWSNSLYRARVLSTDALRAERDNRQQDAEALWDQAVVKTDSVLARRPGANSAIEARWLRGRAKAHVRNCIEAIPDLQATLIERPQASWREEVRLELARCKELVGDPGAGEMYLELLDSRHADTRREAQLRGAHWLISQREYDSALVLLGEADTRPALLDRAAALGGIGRGDSAIVLLTPLIEVADTTVQWGVVLGVMAQHDPRMTDTLLARLLAMPRVKPDLQASWVIAAAKGADLVHDSTTTDRLLRQLLAMPNSPPVIEGRTMAAIRRFAAVTSVAALKAEVDTLTGGRGLQASLGFQLQELVRNALRIIDQVPASVPGTPQGDMAMFVLAESARDSLRAPRLAASLFSRMEHDWPASPYTPKAVLARVSLEADSAAALRARFASFSDSPYLGLVMGRTDAGVGPLEDSLQTFTRAFFRRTAVTVDQLFEAPLP